MSLISANDLVPGNKPIMEHTLPFFPSNLTKEAGEYPYDNEDSGITDVAFNSDGTKMYLLGYTTALVYQYTLSTPWDVSTATYDGAGKNFDASSEDTLLRGIEFKPDGLKMYIAGIGNDRIYEYTLSTAWDPSTATYDGFAETLFVGGQSLSTSTFKFSSDGLNIYLVYSAACYQYTLSTAWDISTGSYTGTFDFNSYAAVGLDIIEDGTKVAIVSAGQDKVFSFTLGTPWDITTCVYDGASTDYSTLSDDTAAGDIRFIHGLNRMYLLGTSTAGRNVMQYTYTAGTNYYYLEATILDIRMQKASSVDGVWSVTDTSTSWSAASGSDCSVVISGNYIHAVYLNSVTLSLDYWRYNILTDTFEATAQVANLSGMGAPHSSYLSTDIVIRAGAANPVVILASGMQDSDMGTDYSRLDLWYGPGTGTPSFTGPVGLDGGIASNHEVYGKMVVEAGLDTHCIWASAPGTLTVNQVRWRTLRDTSTLSTIYSNAISLGGMTFDKIVKPIVKTNKIVAVLFRDANYQVAIDITTATGTITSINSVGANISQASEGYLTIDNAFSLISDGTTLYLLAVGDSISGNDRDIWLYTSTDDGSTWEPRVEVIDAITASRVYASLLDSGSIALAYYDAQSGQQGQYSYEYSLGPEELNEILTASGALQQQGVTEVTSLSMALARAYTLQTSGSAALANAFTKTAVVNSILKALLTKEVTASAAIQRLAFMQTLSSTGLLQLQEEMQVQMTGYLFAVLSESVDAQGVLQSANTLSITSSGALQSQVTSFTIANAALASVGTLAVGMDSNLQGSVKIDLGSEGLLQKEQTFITSVGMALAAELNVSVSTSIVLQQVFSSDITVSAQLILEAIEVTANASGVLKKTYLPETSVSGSLQLGSVSSLSAEGLMAKVFNTTADISAYLFLPVFQTLSFDAVLAGTIVKLLGFTANLQYEAGVWIPEADSDTNTWTAESQKTNTWS